MTLHVRAADPRDADAITALLLKDADYRQSLNSDLWAVARDAEQRVRASLGTIREPVTGPFTHHWIVAEEGGELRGVVHGLNVPPPPLFDLHGGNAGILLDDCYFPSDERVSAALVNAAERALADAGAVLFVAASPAGWVERTGFLQAAGYEHTTFYMARGRIAAAPAAQPRARVATTADIPGIVRLSTLHRAQLKAASPHFWNVHEEANDRFASWMAVTLTLPDRRMFVTGATGEVDGFIVAQPGSPLHLTAAHDLARVGLIDDFHARAFELNWLDGEPSGEPAALLAAAEAELCARGAEVALAICPVLMTRKFELLLAAGYAPANIWMVKSMRC
jgi:hypothetical protein